MRFTKIKHSTKGEIKLVWTTKKESGEEIESTLTSHETPDTDFINAFKALRQVALDIFELGGAWYPDDLRVIGVSINREEKDGRMGAVITCLKSVETANAPLVLNTPHLRESVDTQDEGAGFFIGGMYQRLLNLEEAAARFVEGARAQGELFNEERALATSAAAEA